MKNKILRFFAYIFTRAIIVALVIGLIYGAFLSSTKTSNLYFVIQDALKARLDIILMKANVEDKAKFFSYDYLQSGEYEALRTTYDIYEVAGYNHKFEFEKLFVFPWQTEKTIIVKEAVYTLIGELDTGKISKEEAVSKGVEKMPQWNNSEYYVTLIYENGTWLVDSIEKKADFDYKPPQTPSLSQEEIDALRTPAPAPTPTFDTSQNLTGEHPATISNPIRGDKVNVRIGPATEYDVVEELENGARITVLDESDGWYLIRCESGVEGYISGYYILFD